jgi:dTDP-4-amino-4,6-dideoxygalactose transaminase
MRAAAGALSLPLSSYLTTEDVDRVCDIVLSCAGR